jgi:hypothetical protein
MRDDQCEMDRLNYPDECGVLTKMRAEVERLRQALGRVDDFAQGLEDEAVNGIAYVSRAPGGQQTNGLAPPFARGVRSAALEAKRFALEIRLVVQRAFSAEES